MMSRMSTIGIVLGILSLSGGVAAQESTSVPNNIMGMRVEVGRIAARVEALERQLDEANKARRIVEEGFTQRMLWIAGGVGTFLTLLISFIGLFINSRIKDPEEWRESLRTRLFQELENTRANVATATTTALEKTEARLEVVGEEYSRRVSTLFDEARKEAVEFQRENARILEALRNLTSLGQPSPGEKPEAETLYYLADQARSERGAEGRARGLRYLRRLSEDDIAGPPPVFHNAGILAKRYESIETALKLFRKAWSSSGQSIGYSATYAHELALLGSEKESLLLFDELLAKAPDDDRVFHFYIDSLRSLGLYSQAENALAQNAGRFNQSAKVLREWADLLYHQGKYREALQKLNDACTLDTGDDIAWGYKAKAAFTIGDLVLAREGVLQAIHTSDERSPRLPSHFSLLGDIERERGQVEDAKNAYRASIVAEQVPTRSLMWINILSPATTTSEWVK